MTGGMGGDILMFGFEVLSLHIVLINNVERSFAEGITVQIFRFDGGDISGISWNFGDPIFGLDLLELIVYFFGDVAE